MHIIRQKRMVIPLAWRRCIRLPACAYLPDAASFRPVSTVTDGDRARGSFRELAKTFAAVDYAKQSRDTSVRLLAACFRQCLVKPSANELIAALYLTASQLAPPYEGVELRFSTRSFIPVLKQLMASQTSDDHSNAIGIDTFPDYGLAVQALIERGQLAIHSPEAPMSISFVHEELRRIAKEEGKGSLLRKQQRAVALLQQCGCAEEMMFLVRMLAHQSLRIGMGEKSILAALALATLDSSSSQLMPVGVEENIPQNIGNTSKQWTDCVTKAYAQQPNYGVLVRFLHANQGEKDLQKKIQQLEKLMTPQVGVPVLTMSAYPVSSVANLVERIHRTKSQTATCEYKYDGARVQIHLSLSRQLDNDSVTGRIFSRNMEDNTEKYESLLQILARQLNHQSTNDDISELILEGEVVAIDRMTGSFLPFQVLQTKTTTDFCLFAFDLLSINGENLLQRPLRERRARLHQHFNAAPGYFEFVKHHDIHLSEISADETQLAEELERQTDIVRSFLSQAVASDCEGLMVKLLDVESDYKAGIRSYSWMKVKHDYLSDHSNQSTLSADQTKGSKQENHGTFLADTLDLVPIGAFHGKGRRSGMFGSFLMASYNSDSDKFETIGKVGSGFSEAQLTEMSARLKQHIHLTAKSGEVPNEYHSHHIRSLHPDVWLAPNEVWEIKATQLTASPSYTCAIGMPAVLPYNDGIKNGKKSKGLALRFPRFVRMRPDKTPFQATSSAQVAELFQQQNTNQNGGNKD